jgi:hypothetical protein
MKHQGMNECEGFPHTPICRGHAREAASPPLFRSGSVIVFVGVVGEALQVSCLSTNPRTTAIAAKPRLSPER